MFVSLKPSHARTLWRYRILSGLKDNALLERGIAAPRLCEAINQVLGSGVWSVPERWGAFLITFPMGVSQTWELTDQAWHWDNTLVNHFGQRTTGLFIFTLYSDIQPRGGGTLLVSGSHRLIEQFYHRLSPADQHLKQKSLKSRFAQSQSWLAELTGLTYESNNRTQRFMKETTEVDGVPVNVIEVTGKPGDAYLCHPAIFHAASPNHADVPRFMRVKGLAKQPNPSS
jgi:ectoine hydroxylase-related dioxygenase (phytanoyl-CoA dioxygenase family)